MLKIIVGTLITKDNKVLLVTEKKEGVKGLLNLPAGHLENDESLIEGAIREAKEETGYDINITGLIHCKYLTKADTRLILLTFKGSLKETKREKSELVCDFYDISDIKNNPHLLRAPEIILPALDNLYKERDVVSILEGEHDEYHQ